MKLLHLAVSLSLAASFAHAQKPTLQPFTAERSWEIQRVGAPAISPDGRFAAASVTRADVKENKTLADIWMWSTDGRDTRLLTTHASSESSPLFSPDGQSLAFVAQRDDDKAAQIYVLPLAGGEAVRVTTVPTGVAQPMWFPDGKRIAFLTRVWPDLATFDEQGKRLKEREEAKSKAQIWNGETLTAWDTWLDDRQLHAYAVGLDDKSMKPLTLGTGFELPRNSVPLETPLYDIAPNGREIAFTADSDPALNNSNLDIFTVEIDSRTARNLTKSNEASDSVPRYSPDGRYLAFARQTIKGFYGDNRRLMLLDRGAGTIREVTEKLDKSTEGLVWAGDSTRLFGAIDDAGTARVYEIGIDGKSRALTGESSFSGIVATERGETILVGLRQSFIEPPTLVRVDPASGAVTKLSKVNDALMEGTELGTFESVTYAGANGDPIQMWVNYPPGFDRSRKYPLFVLIHGGPHNAITNGMQFRWNAQVFGSWGFVTAWPNFHGSSGFGNAFTDSINPQQDKLPYEDVIKAADWFAKQSWIDASKMAAGGGSYGGYLTEIILGRKHPFKALVAHAGVYNWYTQQAADYGTEMRRFGGFWLPDQERVFREGSPHFGAASFNTPTIVLHGQRDYRVPLNHGVELYQTLVQRGVPTRFVYFPDENHWVLKPQNSLVWYREVRQWLDRYALGIEPAPAAAGQ